MGNHTVVREPRVSTTGKFLALGLGVASASGVSLINPTDASAAETGILDAIAQCESSGNPNASNGTHFGLFQFDLPTWRSVGGSGDPRNASVSEQYARAASLLAARGTQPWLASKSCWSGKVGAALTSSGSSVRANLTHAKPSPTPRSSRGTSTPSTHTESVKPQQTHSTVTTPVHDSVASSTAPRTHRVVRGDTLSEIAASYGMKTKALWNLNRNQVTNPDKIYPGQILKLR